MYTYRPKQKLMYRNRNNTFHC